MNEKLRRKYVANQQRFLKAKNNEILVFRFYSEREGGLKSMAEKKHQVYIRKSEKEEKDLMEKHAFKNVKEIKGTNQETIYSPFLSTTAAVGKLLDNTLKAGGDRQLKEDVLKRAHKLGSF